MLPGREAEILKGIWTRDGDELVEVATDVHGHIRFGDASWANYDFTFKAMVEQGTTGYSAIFHYNATNMSARVFSVGLNDQGKTDMLDHWFCGRRGLYEGMRRASQFQVGKWCEVRLEVRGPRVCCYVDGEKLFDHTDDRFAHGRVGFSTFSRTGARFRDIAITTPEGKVLWKSPPEIPRE